MKLYTIKFLIPTQLAGSTFTALLGSTHTTPELKPTADPARMMMVFTSPLTGLGTIIAALEGTAEDLAVTPINERVSEAVRPLAPKPQVPTYDMSRVTRLPLNRKKGSHRGSGAGAKAVLATLQEMPIARAADFEPAFRAAGLTIQSIGATLTNLASYGLIVRQSHGAYRLPTEDEKAQHEARS